MRCASLTDCDHDTQAEEYISEAADEASSSKPLHLQITEAEKLAKFAAKGVAFRYLSSPPLEMNRGCTVTDPFCAIQTVCDVLTQKRTQPLDSSGLSKSIPSHRDSWLCCPSGISADGVGASGSQGWLPAL